MPIRSGYARLQRGGVVVLVDAGAAPPLELAGAACAGCLSFELSTGAELLLVNGGTPAPAQAQRHAVARATASHTTLCLGEQSSAKLMRNARLERAIGSALLRHPDRVACEVRHGEGGAIELEASHDGYVEAFGLLHTRTLKLDAAGTRLEGCDRLIAAKGTVRFSWDVPLAIHFHVHPDVEVRIGTSPGDGRAAARQRRALAPDGGGRDRLPGGEPIFRRRRRRAADATGGAARPVLRRIRGPLDLAADQARPAHGRQIPQAPPRPQAALRPPRRNQRRLRPAPALIALLSDCSVGRNRRQPYCGASVMLRCRAGGSPVHRRSRPV